MDALEQKIRQDPDAWEPWLVYADWLAERGDVRGRLIGLEHRRADPKISADERERIRVEIAELLGEHQARWSVPDMPEGCRLEWRHGFVVGARSSLDQPDSLARLLGHPQARLLSSLRLELAVDPDEDWDSDPTQRPPISEALVESVLELDIARLRTFAIQYTPLPPEAAGLLAESPKLASLRELDLRYCQLTAAHAVQLSRRSNWPELRALRLQGNRLDVLGVSRVATLSERLAILDLRENPIGRSGAEYLADSLHVEQLEALYLHRDDVGPAGARALASSDKLPLHIRRYWAGQASVEHEQATPE